MIVANGSFVGWGRGGGRLYPSTEAPGTETPGKRYTL